MTLLYRCSEELIRKQILVSDLPQAQRVKESVNRPSAKPKIPKIYTSMFPSLNKLTWYRLWLNLRDFDGDFDFDPYVHKAVSAFRS